MQKIGSITSTADANGEWTNGNVAAGISPTLMDAAWFNTIQRELANIVTSGGLTLDPANDAQVIAALKKIFMQSGNNLSEINVAGAAAQTAARANIVAAALAGSSTQQFSVAAATNPANAVRLDQFQYGTNGNGAYRTMPGTFQLCRFLATIPANSSYTWTFPLAFSATPGVYYSSLNPGSSATSAMWFNGVGITSCSIFNPNTIPISANLLAVF